MIQQRSNIVPKTCFECPQGDVLRTSWRRPGSTFNRPSNVRLGRPLDVISGRPQDVRSRRPRDDQIGSLGMSWGCCKGTYCGPILAGWVDLWNYQLPGFIIEFMIGLIILYVKKVIIKMVLIVILQESELINIILYPQKKY